VAADEQARLPGHAGTAVVRRFDAPEALETRFYEVRAKSALNRVPDRSRVPFRWTVNPYRGCSHACVYCVLGDTRVLMGTGSAREIRHLSPGDEVYGTVRRGAYRRYVRTTVLDHWMVRKLAYRVRLENGTELIAGADHRFLTNRGWKHVIGAECGPLQRPHLTLGSKLIGTGGFEQPPLGTREYKRGYLCGVDRGDRRAAPLRDGRPSRAALTDFEARARTWVYLDELADETASLGLAAAAGRSSRLRAIAAGSPASAIRDLAIWPASASLEWCKGFLAGAFDAEGSFEHAIVRIASSDPEIVDRTAFACDKLGLPFAVERLRAGMWSVRIRGGLAEQLRFHLLTDPAITRKRSIDGRAVESQSRLRVVSIEPLGIELPLYDITTGTGDFIANGVVSHNCFARPTHEYLDFDAGRDFEKEIVVKVNVPEVLRAELARPSWKREHVAMGTNTDPYQWVEGRYKLMRGIWEALRDAANPCSILTKSPLLLRDLDLMREVAGRTELNACLSVPTIDEKAWRASEPHTPHPRARLEAVAALNRAGIPTGILIAPLMPGINDAPEQVERIIELATAAGAVSIGGQTLFLRGSVREVFFDWLRSYRPDLVPRYERLYAHGPYIPERDRRAIERAAGMPGFRERYEHRRARRASEPPAGREEVRQESLF